MANERLLITIANYWIFIAAIYLYIFFPSMDL